jgi:inorganic pyrophosphatase
MKPHRLQTYSDDSKKTVYTVVETVRGSRNKYKWDAELEAFTLSGVLYAGASFPYDFGFVPSTLAEDGDPVDVLLLMDEAAFVGAVVAARVVGVIEAEQTEERETTRNDRLIAVAEKSQLYRDVQTLDDLSEAVLDGIVHFFVSYNAFRGKTFTPLGRYGPKRAAVLIDEGVRRARRK